MRARWSSAGSMARRWARSPTASRPTSTGSPRTITRDRDLVLSARVIAADLDARGVEREVRPPKPGFGTAGPEREAAETSAW